MMKDHAARSTIDDAAHTNFGRPREALLRDKTIAATRDEVMREAYAQADKEAAEAWRNPSGARSQDTATADQPNGKPTAGADRQSVLDGDAVKQAAYDAYDEELRNAWRNPGGTR